MYMNETVLCETADPAVTTLACYADYTASLEVINSSGKKRDGLYIDQG